MEKIFSQPVVVNYFGSASSPPGRHGQPPGRHVVDLTTPAAITPPAALTGEGTSTALVTAITPTSDMAQSEEITVYRYCHRPITLNIFCKGSPNKEEKGIREKRQKSKDMGKEQKTKDKSLSSEDSGSPMDIDPSNQDQKSIKRATISVSASPSIKEGKKGKSEKNPKKAEEVEKDKRKDVRADEKSTTPQLASPMDCSSSENAADGENSTQKNSKEAGKAEKTKKKKQEKKDTRKDVKAEERSSTTPKVGSPMDLSSSENTAGGENPSQHNSEAEKAAKILGNEYPDANKEKKKEKKEKEKKRKDVKAEEKSSTMPKLESSMDVSSSENEGKATSKKEKEKATDDKKEKEKATDDSKRKEKGKAKATDDSKGKEKAVSEKKRKGKASNEDISAEKKRRNKGGQLWINN